MWSKMLSDKASHAGTPMLVVSAVDRATLETPVHWIDRPPHEGLVTFEEDRDVIYSIMEKLLDQKLKMLKEQKMQSYFYYLARYEVLLGLPVVQRSLGDFYQHFETSLEDELACSDRNLGLLPCAVMSGHADLITMLVEKGLSPNLQLKPMLEVRIMSSLTLIQLAVDVAWREPLVLESLLKARADCNSVDDLGYPVLGFCRTCRDVELLLECRAEVNRRSGPSRQSALSVACEYCAPVEVIRGLLAHGAEVNPSGAGPYEAGYGCPHPLAFLSIWAKANPHVIATAELLLQSKADVNQRCLAGGRWRSLELLSRAYLTLTETMDVQSSMLLKYFAAPYTTYTTYETYYI